MKKWEKLTGLSVLLIFITVLSLKTGSYADELSYYGNDRDGDGILVYSELNADAKANVDAGYGIDHAHGGLGYEMIYLLNNPLITNVGVPHNGYSYHGQAIRTKRYYRLLRTDRDMYPDSPHTWYVTGYWEDETSETGWSAAVTNTAPNVELTTPETIYAGGHTCTVKVLDLKNAYVKRLTVTDNIVEIKNCQTPMLKSFKGGYNVKTIGKEAFKDNIYMANLPYFPFLTSIGSKAFEGCFNLKDVLLPPMIETFWWDAFGWYDVVKGGYSQDSFQIDEEYSSYSLIDEYCKKDKIYGITFYATENTATFDTLKDLLDYAPLNVAHLKYDTSDKYPGLADDVQIPDDELSDWLPPLIDPTTLEWDQEYREVDPKDTVAVRNSVTSDQATVVDYLVMLRIQDKITDDMAVALMGAIVGDNDVPREFLEKFCRDPEAARLMHLYVENATKTLQMRRNSITAEEFKNKRIHDEQMRNLVYYFTNTLSILAPEFEAAGLTSVGTSASVLAIMDNFNNLCDAIARGDSIAAASNKFLTTSGYLVYVSAYAPSPLSLYESTVFILMGNSKGADAFSVVSTGRHLVELVSDVTFGAVVDAYDEARRADPNTQWITFFSAYGDNLKKIGRNLSDTDNYVYGTNLTHFGFIARALTDPVYIRESFDAYCALFTDSRRNEILVSTYLDTAYDMYIEGNYAGMVLYDFVKVHSSLTDEEKIESFYKHEMNSGARTY